MTSVRVHASNVIGKGAVQLFNSLFPELHRSGVLLEAYVSREVEITTRLAANNSGTKVQTVERRLPNALSRMLECTIFAKRFSGEGVLLVLGDIPLNRIYPQVVLVHSPHFIKAPSRFSPSEWKYFISRALFKLNTRHVAAFIVQSKVMKDSIEASYPALRGRVHIIAQPPPKWVLEAQDRRVYADFKTGLSLFYPSAGYSHKNHDLLRQVNFESSLRLAVREITLTVASEDHPGLQSDLIHCVGFLDESQMIKQYHAADVLLFLSKKESYGFPLLEAMWLNMPIICPDLSYAHWMCGDEAIYFDPDCPESLQRAILKMHTQLINGWRPDWSKQLTKIPSDWGECSRKFLDVCKAAMASYP